ncbi:dihydrofolate reductase-like isoform X2 [Schistocerca americana]|uniref:dihydrofolate reductase-like isoform X2 n=2 Tax=Schistocerca TaxID=7008 RepID=UPI001F4F4AC6|nr:dihydrofolate reductase-like isoform X2 [Schistocerca americana]XP_047104158.1 dihydrofolate reductase-like isoform X1 [Schistocerca piceifrons]
MKCNIIVAVGNNNGIGIGGKLPWNLRKELAYFSRMTKSTTDPLKKNAVVMGRKTWESIPEKFRPLPGRLNVVLTRTNRSLGEEVIVHTSLEDAIKDLHNRQDVETVWVIGGSSVYDEMMKSSYCHRLYITNILKDYNCDTFFPEIGSQYKSVSDPTVPSGIQEENGIQFQYKVYENTEYVSIKNS